MDDVIITIPAYEPDKTLTTLVRRIKDDFRSVVIVDDGSKRSRRLFDELQQEDGVIVLKHPANKGKGAALKTAFREVLRLFPNAVGTITVDADGQHLPKDVVRMAESLRLHPNQLTLGVRSFGSSTPFRSKLGNMWSCIEFFLLTGCRIRDTQTGLRGIPMSFLPQLLKLHGDRYEYEMRMLADFCRRRGAPRQVPITTVYSPGNPTSHYRPLTDTWKTQLALFAAAFRH